MRRCAGSYRQKRPFKSGFQRLLDSPPRRCFSRWRYSLWLSQRASNTPSGHRLFFLVDDDVDCIDSESVRRQYPLPAEQQSFVVFCGPFKTATERTTVESIVASGKPAHVGAAVVELDAGPSLDGATFLGINSRLTTRQFSLGATMLGEDTVLVD